MGLVLHMENEVDYITECTMVKQVHETVHCAYNHALERIKMWKRERYLKYTHL